MSHAPLDIEQIGENVFWGEFKDLLRTLNYLFQTYSGNVLTRQGVYGIV